jgi:hypothetical protein
MGFSVRFIVLAALGLGLSSCIHSAAADANATTTGSVYPPPPPPMPDQPTTMNPPVFPPTPSNIDLCAPGYHWDLGHRDSEGVSVRPHCAPNLPPATPPPPVVPAGSIGRESI